MSDIILNTTKTVDEILSDKIDPIVGDTPVSVQLAMALEKMASKDDVNALRSDLVALRKEVENLIALVGDTSVSEQINKVIKQA